MFSKKKFFEHHLSAGPIKTARLVLQRNRYGWYDATNLPVKAP